jgi:hypothetical protein
MYNQKKTPRKPDTVSYEGGASFKLDPKLEIISILVTGFGNTFYEKLSDREVRLDTLIKQVAKTDPEFVAKALVYARSVVGQRSATQFGAVSLIPALSGKALGKRFFSKRNKKASNGGIIYRLDDMLEIIACYQHFNEGKPLPNAMKNGFKAALEAADTYELAKYQGKNKSVSLIDVVNLVHPKPTPEMQETFKRLMEGRLTQFNTVEDKNTKSGQEVAAKVKSGELTQEEAQVELNSAKEENYGELITSGKIGYLALLRNLRNILKTSSNSRLIDEACNLLTNEGKIKGSLVFPHQIDLALEIMLSEGGYEVPRKVLTALDKAYELSIPNLTELFPYGKTAVVYDTSGSMEGGWGSGTRLSKTQYSKQSPLNKASLIAATLGKGIDADVYHFATSCEQVRFNPLDSVNTLKSKFMSQAGRVGHGTNFNSIFQTIGQKYDRVFIITDLQGNSAIESSAYKNMHVYSIDLCGYGSTMFKPGNKVYQIFGYGSDIYEFIKKAEIDPKAILKEIEAIVI